MTLRSRLRAARPALRRSPLLRRCLDSAPSRAALRVRQLWLHRRSAAANRATAAHYLLHGKEVSNFTYELSNRDELARFAALVCGVDLDRISALCAEAESDAALHTRLTTRLASRPDRESEPRFGRRLIWYCIVRTFQPSVVVETGTHDGLGSALLVTALERNRSEGSPGALHSFDIDGGAGWLAAGADPDLYQLHAGDIRQTLPDFLANTTVDVFIHDSLHTYEHELFEQELALKHGGTDLVLISDNARTDTEGEATEATYALRDVCESHGRRYEAFRERPMNHFAGGMSTGVGLP